MKAILLMICLLFSVSCKTNDFISTALCLIRNKTVKEEALNILNKILNKDYENIFQNLATAYIKVKDVLLNQCLNKDDDNLAVLRRLDSTPKCDDELSICTNECCRVYQPPPEYHWATDEINKCIIGCVDKHCPKYDESWGK